MSSIKLFGNLLSYRLCGEKPLPVHELNEMLVQKPARMPGSQELATYGFVTPTGDAEVLAERVNTETHVFAVMIAERMLPAKVIRSAVSRKVRDIEDSQHRKVYAREKQQLKDEIIQKLLPQAFIDTRVIYGMILGPYLIIDTSSVKRAESILDLLRETIGSLTVRPVAVKGTPIAKFTDWFTHRERLHHFDLNGDFKANSSGDEFDFVNGKGTSPEDETLSDLVRDAGRRITQLGLQHRNNEGDPVSFTVNEMLGIKGIKWPDHLIEQANADAGDDEGEGHHITLMRATFMLLAVEIHGLLQDLLLELGGEEAPEGALTEHQARQIDLLNALFKRDLLTRLSEMGREYRESYSGKLVQAPASTGTEAAEDEDSLI